MQQFDVLLVRMDKIGDLVLTLPVDQAPGLEDKKCFWLVPNKLGFVVEHGQPERAFAESSKTASIKNVFDLIKLLKKFKFKAAIVFHAPWWVSFAIWLSLIPIRVGRLSQWHSYLFFNRGLRQKRSRGEKHELEYNLDLVEKLTQKPISAKFKKGLYLPMNSPQSQSIMRHLGLSDRSYYVVHPGMGGSALNWPAEKYKDLIHELKCISKVIVTGTEADEKWLKNIRGSNNPTDNIRWMVGQLNEAQLIAVLSRAIGVVAPSTGVVHLAASTGTPTVGLYSPRPMERAKRWAPRGPKALFIEAPFKENLSDEQIMNQIKTKDVIYKLVEAQKIKPILAQEDSIEK